MKETMSRVDAKVIEVLAVMEEYRPCFEKAGMMRVNNRRNETSIEKKIRSFLEAHNFDFSFVRPNSYCDHFFRQLSSEDRKMLIEYLSEFPRQPFVKVQLVRPGLLARVFSPEGVYLYWVNSSLCK